jgi:putative ATP-binding cassette transporter
MIVALLEDRPILVLDEWPADQDPEFRRYFYEALIPGWRAQGKIVVAVSHDDRYFGCADRVVELEYGRVRAAQAPAAHRPDSTA